MLLRCQLGKLNGLAEHQPGSNDTGNVASERLFTTSLTDYLDCNQERSRRSQPTCILL
jgi:hypothetical protein